MNETVQNKKGTSSFVYTFFGLCFTTIAVLFSTSGFVQFGLFVCALLFCCLAVYKSFKMKD